MSGRIKYGDEGQHPGERRRLERRARSFVVDEKLERLIKMLEADRSLDAKLSPTLRMTLGMYRDARRAAEDLATM